ncbi:MAG: YitT family protein, partial [Lactobacillus sp.]|nr:YitT family protein [Lactobacillus sp.]
FNKKKKICILSKEYEVIQDYIMNTLKRGVTLYSAKGGYDKTEHTELVTIMATNEYKKLLYYLQESDIEAFVTVSTVNEVIGTWNTKKNHV